MPIPPVAAAPVEGAPPIVPVAAEASPAEVEESKAKAEENAATKPEETTKPDDRRRSKFLKKPLALDLRKRSVKEDKDAPPATAPLERPEPVGNPVIESAITKERSQSFSGGRQASSSSPTDDEPRSGTSKLKNWFSSHFSRPRTKSTASAPDTNNKAPGANPDANTESGFIGGAALRRRTNSSGSSASSMRDVALASVAQVGALKEQGLPATAARDASPARSVSSPVSIVRSNDR